MDQLQRPLKSRCQEARLLLIALTLGAARQLINALFCIKKKLVQHFATTTSLFRKTTSQAKVVLLYISAAPATALLNTLLAGGAIQLKLQMKLAVGALIF